MPKKAQAEPEQRYLLRRGWHSRTVNQLITNDNLNELAAKLEEGGELQRALADGDVLVVTVAHAQLAPVYPVGEPTIDGHAVQLGDPAEITNLAEAGELPAQAADDAVAEAESGRPRPRRHRREGGT